MKLIKNIKLGKVSFLKFFIILIIGISISFFEVLESNESLVEKYIEINILDKVSSKIVF